MTGWINTFFSFEYKSSLAGFLGSGLKSIFQLKALFKIKKGLLLRALALSFLVLAIVTSGISLIFSNLAECFGYI